MNTQRTVAERLVEAREAIGFSQSETAQRAGVALRTLKSWEAGKSEPRANRLQMLAGVLQVSLVWLLNGSGELPGDDARTSRLNTLELKVRRLQELQTEANAVSLEITRELREIRDLDAELEKLAS